MEQEKIWSQITRRIAGEGDDEDIQQVEKWLAEKPQNRKVYKHLQQIWEQKAKSKDYSSLYDAVKRRIYVNENQPRSIKRYLNPLLKIAALVAVVFLSNVIILQFNKEPVVQKQTVTWHEVEVPRGNRIKLMLPDSTTVWITNETKLKYPSDFNEQNRLVELSGEAYFNVKHNEKQPFIVKMGKQQIKVLGTRFSVYAYPDNNIIETSLISGSIAFSSDKKINGKTELLVEPGYKINYNKKNNTISREKIQPDFFDYWERGSYAFNGESFENLALKIKRIFNVEIYFEDKQLKNKTFTGTINVNDNIYVFMEAIRRTSVEPLEYTYNKNTIHVKLKKISTKL
jgi:ferric-dicitrate binding protein FerR (iron transport regulator)